MTVLDNRATILKRIFGVALALALVAAMSVPAAAHVKVKKRAPKKGGTACTTVKNASVTFSGPILSGTLKVTRLSNGKKVSKGSGGRDPNNITKLKVGLKKGKLKPGTYRANWNIVAGDGDAQKGKWKFSLAKC